MTSSGWAVVVAILVVLIAGGAWWYTAQAPTIPAENTNPASGMPVPGSGVQETEVINDAASGAAVAEAGTVSAPKTITVTYNEKGFSPASVTIAKGDTVAFINSTPERPMWVGADEHPNHTGYDSTDRSTHCAAGYSGPKPFDQCAKGDSYSFTFTKTGSFSYHNHASAQFGGTIVVQ